jgi:hypothetical protein
MLLGLIRDLRHARAEAHSYRELLQLALKNGFVLHRENASLTRRLDSIATLRSGRHG